MRRTLIGSFSYALCVMLRSCASFFKAGSVESYVTHNA